MPDPNLQSYLAQHYLSGPKADAILARNADGKVKRKKKKPNPDAPSSSSGGLVFKDDSDSWKVTPDEAEEDDGLTPQVVGQVAAGPSKAFRKIGSKGGSDEKDTLGEDKVEAAEEAPTFKAGLRSKEEMKAARVAREERKKREAAATPRPSAPTAEAAEDDDSARLAQETVYRDSSGRVIDIKSQVAAEEAQAAARARKDEERSTWGQGLVQKQERQRAAAELSSVRSQGIARKADDANYNRHFKEQLRADDPALAFLTKKRDEGPKKPKYKGNWPPNRYNIPPGYRWDGVDRGNGFEEMLFERKSALARRDTEARAWGQSDM